MGRDSAGWSLPAHCRTAVILPCTKFPLTVDHAAVMVQTPSIPPLGFSPQSVMATGPRPWQLWYETSCFKSPVSKRRTWRSCLLLGRNVTAVLLGWVLRGTGIYQHPLAVVPVSWGRKYENLRLPVFSLLCSSNVFLAPVNFQASCLCLEPFC